MLWGPEDRIIPGNAVAVDPSMPFSTLTKFGTEFLNKFQASLSNSPVLEKVYFVDSPGVLSGEKQKLGRSYDFVKVTEWFAQRADLILLLFDAHKLDISDEFQAVIKSLKGQDDKIRVVLNKADKVTSQQLMRVYGAMMWSLGKVVNTPEVMRVYIGSFWDGPCMNPDLAPMYRSEQADLLRDLHDLPRYTAVRKINELVKRARMARVHALIIGHLKGQMPFFGQASAQKKMLESMADQFFAVMKKYRLPQGDFPNVNAFREVASTYDWGKWKVLDEKLLKAADEALTVGIPKLLRQLGEEQDAKAAHEKEVHSAFMESGVANPTSMSYTGSEGRMIGTGDDSGVVPTGVSALPPGSSGANPFGGGPAMGRDANSVWAALVDKTGSDSVFKLLPGGQEGLVSGAGAKDFLMESGLDVGVLRQVWDLSDLDKDGFLDQSEFAVATYLIREAKAGKALPAALPTAIIPPSKRSA